MITKPFKCKMISTTNVQFAFLPGQSNTGLFSGHVFYFGSFHTSYIKEIQVENDIMTLKTRNSTYVFQLLEPVDIENWKISTEKQDKLEKIIQGQKD